MPSTTSICDDPRLQAALDYALESPGKQLRSRICIATADMVAGQRLVAAEVVGQAIEFLHTYSLIHDDLPAMDDDDLRRGKPSLHVAYDEATAILVGDGLQALAFEWVAQAPDLSAEQKLSIVQLLASCVGFSGMVGGQALDIAAEARSISLDELKRIHAQKTGALIQASVGAGAICAGASDQEKALLSQFAKQIGLAFQVMDDVLDVTATSEELGKTAGKDEASEKSTYVAELGVEGARNYATELLDDALNCLDIFGDASRPVADIAKLMVNRKS